jgi:hypothetical protein
MSAQEEQGLSLDVVATAVVGIDVEAGVCVLQGILKLLQLVKRSTSVARNTSELMDVVGILHAT